MNYKVEALPNEPIVLVTVSKQYSVSKDMSDLDAELKAVLDKSGELMFMILDARELSLNLEDVIHSSNWSARGEQALLHHPNLRELVVVSPSSLVRLAIQGLNSVTFGNVNARVFKTTDEALAYARSEPEA